MIENSSITVVILNYNYQRYLDECIRSVINQTLSPHQIIVVDDGSTDNSRKIIDKYTKQVISIYKENGGMISSANEAFKYLDSDYVLFLDADDYLMENCIQEASKFLKERPALVHYYLQMVDDNKNNLSTFPKKDKYKLSSGNLINKILKCGSYIKSSTSGNIYSKKALLNLMPINDHKYSIENTYHNQFPLDAYLTNKIIYYGDAISIDKTLAFYRQHGTNYGSTESIWNSKNKRIRTFELLKNDVEFARNNNREDIAISFLKDIRVVLNLLLIESFKHEVDHFYLPRNFLKKLSVIFKSLKLAIKNKVIPYRHSYLLLFVCIFVALMPKKLVRNIF
jgi:glycosyltransferase involved in cell wall biosynthesis